MLTILFLSLTKSSELLTGDRTIRVVSDGGAGKLNLHLTPFFFLHVWLWPWVCTVVTNLCSSGYCLSSGMAQLMYLSMNSTTLSSGSLSKTGASLTCKIPCGCWAPLPWNYLRSLCSKTCPTGCIPLYRILPNNCLNRSSIMRAAVTGFCLIQ